MTTQTLVSEVLRRGQQMPDKPAFVFYNKSFCRTVLTFKDVSILSQRFAALLRHKYGVEEGDVVCNTLSNSPERLISQLGTLMSGAVDMNGQLRFADGADFVSSLNDGKAKAVIYDKKDVKGAYAVLKGKVEDVPLKGVYAVACPEVPSLKTLIPCILEASKGEEKSLFEDLVDETKTVCVDRGSEALSVYMCTSGSTGLFKTVAFTGRFPMDWGKQWGEVLGVKEDSVYLNDRPFGWIGGYPSVTFVYGCTRVVVDSTVSKATSSASSFFWKVVGQERCTESYTVPLQLSHLIEEAQRNPHADSYMLKRVGVGSGPISRGILKALGTVSQSLSTVYASTEASVMATMNISREDAEYKDFVSGKPTPGTEIKIVDNDLKEMPTGEIGDILIKPLKTLRCVKYLNNEKANTETFLSGGWIKLGDRGFLDAEGRVSVLGRGKNAIMRGPFIVYPEQLEFRIKQCHGVSDVAVVGVPDSGNYEELCVLLVRQEAGLRDGAEIHSESGTGQRNEQGLAEKVVDEESVKQFCQSLFLDMHHVETNEMPKYFRFVEALPTLGSGKIDREEAKRLARGLV